MALSQHHVTNRMLPGLLSVIVALGAAAGSPTTEPSTFVCPRINATHHCDCSNQRVFCDGLDLADLSFIEFSASAIVSLFASHNELREVPANFLPGATKLLELTLSHNKIARIDGQFFESLPSLIYLDLSYNRLVTFYLPRNGLPNLEILNLTNNFLSDLKFDADRPIKTTWTYIKRDNICEFSALQCIGLEQLYLSHNKIENNLQFLDNLTHVQILTLGFNNISKIDSKVLPCNDELRCLYLNNNALSDLTFLNCTEYLDKLNVSSNVISTIPENTFTNLTLLRYLDIANNIISSPKFLQNISPYTEFLDLSHNELSVIPANTMINLSELKYVYFSHNKLTDISFASSLEKLEVLFADSNNISKIDRSTFLRLRPNVIKNISFSNNFLSNIAFLKQLRNITNVNLNNNKIIGVDEDIVSQLKKLEYLDLSSNKIRNVNFVNKVHFLRFLNLSNNSVTQFPCNDVLQNVYLNANNINNLNLNCAPNLRYLYMYGGIFRDAKEQELRTSKEVELSINNDTITFPCFPTLEIILKCKEKCSQVEAYNILCETEGTIFSSPIAIVIYCFFILLCILVIILFLAKCSRLRRRIDKNRECLCGKGESVHRHQTFTRGELCL